MEITDLEDLENAGRSEGEGGEWPSGLTIRVLSEQALHEQEPIADRVGIGKSVLSNLPVCFTATILPRKDWRRGCKL